MVEGRAVGVVVAVVAHAVASGPRVRHADAQADQTELLTRYDLCGDEMRGGRRGVIVLK